MSASTVILNCDSVNALRAMALMLIPHLKWRHHGIGVLQGYVSEGYEPEIRLHIWCRKLLKEGMDQSGDIHDHRFDMVSNVLAGIVAHEEIIPVKDDNGDWEMLALTHARAASDTNYHGPTTPLPGKFSVARESYYIPAGKLYSFARGKFHRSPLPHGDDLTITCIEKYNQTDNAARILFPSAKPPVMAFGHEMDHGLIGSILARAVQVLKDGIQTH